MQPSAVAGSYSVEIIWGEYTMLVKSTVLDESKEIRIGKKCMKNPVMENEKATSSTRELVQVVKFLHKPCGAG